MSGERVRLFDGADLVAEVALPGAGGEARDVPTAVWYEGRCYLRVGRRSIRYQVIDSCVVPSAPAPGRLTRDEDEE